MSFIILYQSTKRAQTLRSSFISVGKVGDLFHRYLYQISVGKVGDLFHSFPMFSSHQSAKTVLVKYTYVSVSKFNYYSLWLWLVFIITNLKVTFDPVDVSLPLTHFLHIVSRTLLLVFLLHHCLILMAFSWWLLFFMSSDDIPWDLMVILTVTLGFFFKPYI